jgi:hypothetical protein
MGKINWGRVFLGGLLAGVVVNVFEFVANGLVLASSWDTAMRNLGRQMPRGAIAVFVLVGFLVGITAVWLYAAARPRYGPGPRTAVLIGFGYWLIGYALPTLGWAAMGLIPRRLLAIGTVVGLVEIVAATVIGAWLYTEEKS